jgi:hypothetical protein
MIFKIGRKWNAVPSRTSVGGVLCRTMDQFGQPKP